MTTTIETTFHPRAAVFTPEALTSFEPSGPRATFLDQSMRHELADSIRYVLRQANGQLALPENDIQQFLTRVEKEPISPLAFSFYADAVLAIEDDDLAEAQRLLSELIQCPSHPGGPTLVDLADPKQDPLAQRFVRFIDTDPRLTLEIYSPSREAADNCRRLIRAAFALMDAGDPHQAAEIRGLLREIVLAAGTLDPKALTFDGASSFMLWGGIIINANQRDSELAMAQMLVHESSHNLLFGLCTHGPLVENADDELFASPLRPDPRPMDGIYHATFVTARMHRVVKRLLDSRTLSPSLTEKARKELADNARLFAGGIQTVRQHAKMTPLGQSLMQNATNYMTSATT